MRHGEKVARVRQGGIDGLRRAWGERTASGRERKSAVGPNARASRRMSFRVHDGVDALEARRACGGSFSSRSYVDRKTFHVVTSSLYAPSSARDRKGARDLRTPRSPIRCPYFFFSFIFKIP